MPASPEDLFQYFRELVIETATHHHPPLHTVEESKRLRGDIPGGHCKSLFLKDKKGALWLVVMAEDKEVAMRELRRRIGAATLSFARPELLAAVLGVAPGAVTPFALINDAEGRVRVVLDQEMMAAELLNYHPLVNTMTTTIAPADLVRFLRASGHEPEIIPL